MTDNDKALATELRGIASELSCNQYAAQVWVIGQAADRIEALTAENERLREALELADAALRGANMNMNVVERKVRAALAGKAEQ